MQMQKLLELVLQRESKLRTRWLCSLACNTNFILLLSFQKWNNTRLNVTGSLSPVFEIVYAKVFQFVKIIIVYCSSLIYIVYNFVDDYSTDETEMKIYILCVLSL